MVPIPIQDRIPQVLVRNNQLSVLFAHALETAIVQSRFCSRRQTSIVGKAT